MFCCGHGMVAAVRSGCWSAGSSQRVGQHAAMTLTQAQVSACFKHRVASRRWRWAARHWPPGPALADAAGGGVALLPAGTLLVSLRLLCWHGVLLMASGAHEPAPALHQLACRFCQWRCGGCCLLAPHPYMSLLGAKFGGSQSHIFRLQKYT